MSNNPITRIRFLGDVAIVAVVLLALGAMFWSETYWSGWPWLIGAVSLGSGTMSIAAHLLFPKQVAAAWDEQNSTAYRASLAFGYWAAITVFVILLGAVFAQLIEARAAFFWMAPVLAIAPQVHYLTSIARGRAE